jgi:probable HAF family extracellular repeat protein
MKFTAKSALMTTLSTVSLLAGIVIPVRMAAQEQPAVQTPALVRYEVIDLGTLPGGTFSQPFFMNNHNVIAGSSNLSNNTQHAVLWFGHRIRDLGTLGGPNSFAFAVNAVGSAAGEAETSVSDPAGEDFCGFGTHLICSPFVWSRAGMKPLPTLGGNNGAANLINRWGIVAGVAENTTADPACPAPQVYQFKPVVWGNGKAIELPTENGDPEGIAFAINDYGQAVGGSGVCSTFNPNTFNSLQSVHALLWQNGKAVDLGNLGGTTGKALGNIAFAINNRGQAVGTSDLAGDTTSHAFLWTQATGMQDLGTLPGDVASLAPGINDQGVVVGLSLSSSFSPRAFVWQKGVMTDLNTLVQANSPLYLLTACGINSRGEITGLGATSTGEIHTYRAVPIKDESSGEGQQ